MFYWNFHLYLSSLETLAYSHLPLWLAYLGIIAMLLEFEVVLIYLESWRSIGTNPTLDFSCRRRCDTITFWDYWWATCSKWALMWPRQEERSASRERIPTSVLGSLPWLSYHSSFSFPWTPSFTIYPHPHRA